METHLLRHFLHVAELGSLSRAAERLHLSQPALSRQIKQLEENLDVTLFERTGRGVRLTEAGILLEQRARPLLTELEALATEVSARGHEITGTLTLVIPPAFGASLMGDVLETYRARCPRVHLRVGMMLSGEVHDGLMRSTIDLGVLYPPLRSRGLTTRTLWTEQLEVVGAPALISNHPMDFEEALTMPLLLPSAPHGLRLIVEAHAATRGATLGVDVEVNSLRVMIELLRRGLGVTFLPRRAVADALSDGSLTAAPLTEGGIERPTLLAWSSEQRLSRAAQAMVEVVEEAVAGATGRA